MGFFRLILNYANSLHFRKLSLALSMQIKLIYVGPESQGPHYFESGKLPHGDKTRVILQREDGTRVPGTWFGNEQAFYTEGGWTTTFVCWWHFPQPVPATEREWFDKAALDLGYGVKKHNVDGIQYSAFLGDYDFPDWQGVLRENADDCIDDCYDHWPCGCSCRKEVLRENADDCIDDCYDHWVAAGRP